jgi:hypothetical protein
MSSPDLANMIAGKTAIDFTAADSFGFAKHLGAAAMF